MRLFCFSLPLVTKNRESRKQRENEGKGKNKDRKKGKAYKSHFLLNPRVFPSDGKENKLKKEGKMYFCPSYFVVMWYMLDRT